MAKDIKNIKPSYARNGNSKSASISQRLREIDQVKKAPGMRGLSRFA